MKLFYRILSILLMVGILSILLPAKAISEENSCYLQTNFTELHIIVYEVYPSETVGELIWKGIIKEGQRITIKSNYGRFFYEYSQDTESVNSMVRGIVHWCSNGAIVDVP